MKKLEMLNEIKKVYKYIEGNSDRGSLLGPVTSALVKLNQDLWPLPADYRKEVAHEVSKLRTHILDSLKKAEEIEKKKRAIKEANKR